MTDERIIELFWQRDESAVNETALKYGSYCRIVAKNILGSLEDCEECLNDTWLRAWNSIPPQRPQNLKIFLAKIARNLAFDRYRKQSAEKRGGGETSLILEELSECISSGNNVENTVLSKEIGVAINKFLGTLSERDRNIFVRRYFFSEATETIAKKYALSANNIMVILTRTRKKLKEYLTGEELL
ncbi:MAG: RNA polymerase sigma factor [Ruminococcaceae bacterium]|nr:RNA polymerase sigma factor [Oscillospiraceae bacterium]